MTVNQKSSLQRAKQYIFNWGHYRDVEFIGLGQKPISLDCFFSNALDQEKGVNLKQTDDCKLPP